MINECTCYIFRLHFPAIISNLELTEGHENHAKMNEIVSLHIMLCTIIIIVTSATQGTGGGQRDGWVS